MWRDGKMKDVYDKSRKPKMERVENIKRGKHNVSDIPKSTGSQTGSVRGAGAGGAGRGVLSSLSSGFLLLSGSLANPIAKKEVDP